MASAAEQFFNAHLRVEENGCWLWTGSHSRDGYGRLSVARRSVSAHRFSYELHVGPIPDGLQLDHLCRVRDCVNPAHLEAVTQTENVRRGVSVAVANGAKTHCDSGHEFTPENTYIRAKGFRQCRRCNADAAARLKQKRRAA